MRLRPAAALVFLLAAAGCGAPRAAAPGRAPAIASSLRVGVAEGDRTIVQRVALEDYVRATIISEFAPAAGDPRAVERMLEVQAVISRTYAIAHLGRHAKDGFDLCSTTHCQLFQPGRLRTSRWAGAAGEAVRGTAGLVLWYGGAPASALFHADCGGRTSRATDVWGGTGAPYLSGIVDDGPAASAHTDWRYEAPAAAIERALNGDARSRVGSLTGIVISERDGAGRAERVSLRGTDARVLRGEELRDVLSRTFGARSIRSTRFDIERERGSYVFTGRGFGHGVGLCQAGAFARIAAGASTTAVLTRYYPGVRILETTHDVIAYTTILTPNFVLSSR